MPTTSVPQFHSRLGLERFINQQAADPQVRDTILKDPRAAAAAFFGKSPPAGFEIEVIAETGQQLVLVKRFYHLLSPEPVPPDIDRRALLTEAVNRLCLADPPAWAELKADPAGFLQRNLHFSAQVPIRLVEEIANQVVIVLYDPALAAGWSPTFQIQLLLGLPIAPFAGSLA